MTRRDYRQPLLLRGLDAWITREPDLDEPAEVYTAPEVGELLNRVYDEIDAMGGQDPHGRKGRDFWASYGYNHAIDNALAVLVELGAKPRSER